MKQPDFFKQFSEKMQNATPPPDFSGADWEALSARLDANERKRWRVLPIGWLAGLTGLLLLSNLGWFFAWKKSSEVTNQSNFAQANETPKPVTIQDTVYTKHVVYQYDTIYRTVVIKQFAQANSPKNWALENASKPSFSTKNNFTKTAQTTAPTDESTTNLDPRNPTEKGLLTGNLTEAEKAKLDRNAAQQADLDALACLEIEPFPWGKRPVLPATDDLPMKPAKEEKTAFPLIPRSFALSAEVGGFKPKEAAIAGSSGFAVGLLGEIGFSDNLALTLKGSFTNMNFQGYVNDPQLGFPDFQSPGDEYDFKYFETNDDSRQILQLGLGMRYYFLAKNKLNPWLGAAWSAQWNPGYELEVEYVNRVNGMEKSREVGVPSTSKPLNYAGFDLGLRYGMGKHWQALASSAWDFKTGNQAGIRRWATWRLGLGYRF